MCFHGWRVQYSTKFDLSLSSSSTERSAASKCVRGWLAGWKTRCPKPTARASFCSVVHVGCEKTPSQAVVTIQAQTREPRRRCS
eukprot:scaffold1105_cov140-Isochrysis_galbana.AAC.14